MRVVSVLAVTWLLDGLEGSLGGSLAGALKGGSLGFTDTQLGISSSFYLGGAVAGALVFGSLADRRGRRRLFFWTLLLYLLSTAATGLSWNLPSFIFFRVLTGAGIGGEYAAINSAVDEIVPARLRGRIDIWINGTFWLGIIVGSLVATAFLSPRVFGRELGWRLAFCSGVPLGLAVLVMRRCVPESPRWLIVHGRVEEAESILKTIEASVTKETGAPLPPVVTFASLAFGSDTGLRSVLRMLTGLYRRRASLCFGLMASQAFFYNSVFFSLALVLIRYYGVSADRLGACFIPIACANFLGPILLGRLFDTIGRKPMIAATYCLSGVVLLWSSWLFYQERLTVISQIMWWAVSFFFASSAASSAYLTVSEVFPQRVRATSIALFYAFGTLAGGVMGPLIFGHLTGSESRRPLLLGYALGATVMLAAGVSQAVWGMAAEGKPLEDLVTLTNSSESRA